MRCCFLFSSLALCAPSLALAAPAGGEADPQVIVVTASRRDLLGQAETASQGTVTHAEVALRPIYRPGQLLESVPGLVVTIHSGEGKAQQYLIRGYNLDHGTDFASYVDDMPVNRPTNAHGQGYSDISFLIPQLVATIDYTKGPYYAAIGDFGSVASAHTALLDDLPGQAAVTVGTDGYQSLFEGGTLHLRQGGRLLAALELGHYDGPWQPAQNFRKINAVARYSRGSAGDGLSITAMAYASEGRLMTDQPARAVEQGLIGRYGTLDPSDYSKSQRYSVSAHWGRPVGAGQLVVSLYAIHSKMALWSNFTHYFQDLVNGDQEEQDETRTTLGGAGSYALKTRLLGRETQTIVGLQARYDAVFVDRKHTLLRDTVLGTCYQEQDDPPLDTIAYAAAGGNCTADRVRLLMLSPYVEQTMHWTRWLRTVVGLRADYQYATDHNLARAPEANGAAARPARASGSQLLLQPKAGIVLGPWARSEIYVSWGQGFHSNDVRGVFGFDAGGHSSGTRLLSRTSGMEVGLRTGIVPRLNLQVAVFQQDFSSELAYNADIGADEATAPSRRQGLEISGQYHPLPWLELNTDLAFARPRYRCAGNGTGAHGCENIEGGNFIADAPRFIYSAGVLVNNLGPWSGALQWRRLGTHSLTDGPQYPQDGGYSEWNLDVSYEVKAGRWKGWKGQVGIFNLFNSRDMAASYYYTSRLPGEAAAGVAGGQSHPLEPRSLRFTLGHMW
ncbi:MAG TPA: TonB-dependent receptor plug domain-containing protein [Novosphingobium sp.]|nr:TonB-dependent receptor plug domain-containing protein [Novosphingobium sp.]